jgi:hypothetical protein
MAPACCQRAGNGTETAGLDTPDHGVGTSWALAKPLSIISVFGLGRHAVRAFAA